MKLFDFSSMGFSLSNSTYDDRENYYMQHVDVNEMEEYLKLLNEFPKEKFFKANNEIKFFDIAFGCNTAAVTRDLGIPRFRVERELKDIKTTILFYKKSFFGYKTVVQIHIVNNAFVFGAITVPYHKTKIDYLFSKILALKYTEELASRDIRDYLIIDDNQNKIVYKNNFYPSLNYISSNIQALENLRIASLEKVSTMSQRHSSKWFDRL